MRRMYFYAAALALGTLSSCSNDPEVSASGNGASEGRQAILLNVNNPNSVVVTRGTGTVGDLKDDVTNNVWRGESLRIMMFKKGTFEYAVEGEPAKEVFKDLIVTAPSDQQYGAIVPSDGEMKYFPTTGQYDFFGYRIDDANPAAASAESIAELSDDQRTMQVDFTIDGSQDLMVAKAAVSEENSDLKDYAYSAYTARRDVQPDLKFNHLLTRLTFNAIAAEAEAADPVSGVRVTAIKIKSRTTGKMIVAYTEDAKPASASDYILWDDATEELSLKQRVAANAPLEALEEVSLQWDETANGGLGAGIPVKVGEALLVSPEETYEMIVEVAQTPDANTPEHVTPFSQVVDLKTGMPFLPGYSYNVNITLYGLKTIEVSAELNGWENGGDVNLTPEDDEFLKGN